MTYRWESDLWPWARTSLGTAYLLRTVPSVIAEEALYGQTLTPVEGVESGAADDVGALVHVSSLAGVESGAGADVGAALTVRSLAGVNAGSSSDEGDVELQLLTTDLYGASVGLGADVGALGWVRSLGGAEGGAGADHGAMLRGPRPDALRLVASAEPHALVRPENDVMVYRKQYDTHPPLRVYLLVREGGEEGPAPGLAGAAVVVRWRRPSGAVSTRACVIEDDATGLVLVPAEAGDFDERGVHTLEFVLTTVSGVETYPKRGYYQVTVFPGL